MSNPVSATPVSSNSYYERVLPSVFSLLPIALVLPTTYLTFLLINPVTGLVLGTFVTIAVLVSIWFAAPVIELDRTGFSVGDVNLPLGAISEVRVIEPEDAFSERGVKLSPAAFSRFQLSVKKLIRIDIADPDDSTPYWLVATRNPELISQLIEQLKASDH